MHQSSSASYTLVPADDLETEIDDELSAQDDVESRQPKVTVSLSAADKWRLVKPMLLKYMLPLCKHSLLLVTPIRLIIYHQFVFIL
jgi:battenin